MYSLSDYTYHLPPELIAQYPVDPPDQCRLLVYDRDTQQLQDQIFTDLVDLISADSLLVFNNSKVLKARIPLPKISGEIFFLQQIDLYTFDALVRPGKKFKVGQTIQLDGSDTTFEVVAITEEGRRLKCSEPIMSILDRHGQMPLPPYIDYTQTKADPYQPIFAKHAGSVASPTASLHFTHELLTKLRKRGVTTRETTLHVGLGTFKQVDVEQITTYDIHTERIEIPLGLFDQVAESKQSNRPLVAVGTTVTRNLESLPYVRSLLSTDQKKSVAPLSHQRWSEQIHSETNTSSDVISNLQLHSHTLNCTTKLYIYPGYEYRIIDQLITNFHLPKSSLLMLVAAFMGFDEMHRIYQHAIDQHYRFYSFGDAMWIK